MLSPAVVIACFAAAAACLALALVSRIARRRGPLAGAELGAVAFALLFLGLAAAAAAVDEKVADGGERAAARPDGGNGGRAAGSTFAYPLEASELRGFSGTIRAGRRPSREPTCVAQFHAAARPLGRDRTYKWWTTCEEAARLDSIAEVRERLALPPAWGPRDTVAVACLPAGTHPDYVTGRTAPVDSEGRRYGGGALQLRFLRFDEDWIVSRHTLPDPPAPLRVLDELSCR